MSSGAAACEQQGTKPADTPKESEGTSSGRAVGWGRGPCGHRDVCSPGRWTHRSAPGLLFGILWVSRAWAGWPPSAPPLGRTPGHRQAAGSGKGTFTGVWLTTTPLPASSGSKPALRAKTANHILPLFCFTQEEQGVAYQTGVQAGLRGPGRRGILIGPETALGTGSRGRGEVLSPTAWLNQRKGWEPGTCRKEGAGWVQSPFLTAMASR